MQSTAGPISSGERILTLDAVRGVALLGIFIMNMPFFGASAFSGADGSHAWPMWWDRSAEILRDVLFSGKFNSMFSLLFAVGFTIQLDRLQRKLGSQGVWIYARRIFWLLLFGVIHACVFWTGDVLHMYALFGFLLLFMRRFSDRTLIGLIVTCLLYIPIRGTLRILLATPEDSGDSVALTQMWEASNNLAYGSGSFLDAAREHTKEMIFIYTDRSQLLGFIGFYVQMFTTVLIGLLLGRHRFFQRAGELLGTVRRVQWWALAVGVLTGTIFGSWEALVDNPSTPTVWRVVASVSYALCRVSIMTFYVAIVVRGVENQRWRGKFATLALAGRMPLSNYLFQTLAATFFFYGWGLGFWNKVGPALGLVLAIAFFFLVQVPLSAWWLKSFELGPMEYLWRRLTYGRFRQTR